MTEDGLSYTFTMKDGLKWSDGTELNAKMLSTPGRDSQTRIQVLTMRTDHPTIIPRMTVLWILEASEDGKTFSVNLVAPCA